MECQMTLSMSVTFIWVTGEGEQGGCGESKFWQSGRVVGGFPPNAWRPTTHNLNILPTSITIIVKNNGRVYLGH